MAAERITFEREGITYRVRDARFVRHRWRAFPVGDARATHRLFVPPREAHNGLVPVYPFGQGEDRAPEPDALARQLRNAAWAPRERPETPQGHTGTAGG